LRAQNLPAAAGWQWLTHGFAIYRRNPLLFALQVMTYWFVMLFVNIVPLLGTLVASLINPALLVGLMLSARHLEQGKPISVRTLFEAFRDDYKPLLWLGGLYLIASLAALSLSVLADGGDFLRFLLAGDKAERAAFEQDSMLVPLAFIAGGMLPVLMAWWFAPVLVAWHRQAVGKALFFSFMACVINWRPFLVYSLALVLIGGILPGMALGLLGVLLPTALAPLLGTLALFAAAGVLAPTLFASFYVAYRDIFGISEVV
jgi:hypothetical protein